MANKQLIALTTTGSGKVEIDSDVLGTGGEGSVYSIVSGNVAELPPSELVAKLYHDPSEGSRATKLKAMLKSPPHNDSVAWPLAILITPDKKFVGYVMKKLASHNFRAWSELAHAAQRRETASSFDVKYAITAIYNLSAAIYSVHNAGHRIGPSNKYGISFQSRLGGGWLTPFTDFRLKELPGEGVKNLLIVCPAFVSDCLETLEEIAMRGKETFLEAGGESFTMIPCLNVHPLWIDAIVHYINLQDTKS